MKKNIIGFVIAMFMWGINYPASSDQTFGFQYYDKNKNHYGAYGEYLGQSRPSFNNNTNHYGAYGEYLGNSRKGFNGTIHHYGSRGEYIGSSRD